MMNNKSEFVVKFDSVLDKKPEESKREQEVGGGDKKLNSELGSEKTAQVNEESERADSDALEDDGGQGKVSCVKFLEIFGKLSLNSKKNLFEFIEDSNLLELRITCKKFNKYCNGYIRYSLKNCYFFNIPLTRLTIDFWFTVTRFFFLEAGRVFPLNRVRYNPIVAALKHNHKILPVSIDQMKSHVLVSLDKLLPEHIVFCNHFHPQPHTCDVNLEIKGQSKVFFDEIDILKFVKHYFDHLEVTDDELIRGSRQLTRHRLALYFYELLKSIKTLSEKGNGVFKLSRIEYVVNTGTLLRHRIWHQLYASWGGGTRKHVDQSNKANNALSKSSINTSNSEHKSHDNFRPKRLSDDNSMGKVVKSVNNNNEADFGRTMKKNTDELVIEINLTIADHFQWDS